VRLGRVRGEGRVPARCHATWSGVNGTALARSRLRARLLPDVRVLSGLRILSGLWVLSGLLCVRAGVRGPTAVLRAGGTRRRRRAFVARGRPTATRSVVGVRHVT